MTFWQVEPLGVWGKPMTKSRASHCRFSASWTDTMNLLVAEADKLNVRGAIALRIDVQYGDIRRDGMLRANARVNFPGVVVSFESRFGPLSYATDAYDHWQANIRAVALSLQALRAVDRYGVSRSGEQYVGWRAIESGLSGLVLKFFVGADDALAWLCAGVNEVDSNAPVADLVRIASKLWHPDVADRDRTTWDSENWDRLTEAKLLLKARGLL